MAETIDEVMSRPLTGVERLRLFAEMPDTFTFDENDAQDAINEIDSMVAEQPADCTFLYFKPSGKWKYEGRGRFPRPQHDGWHDVDRNEIIRENGSMPGINSRATDLVVIVIPDEACDVRSAYPRMLKPEEA